MEHDGESHYFEFDFPEDWEQAKRIEFRWELCRKTSGMVICRCGLWLDEDYDASFLVTQCSDCGREYLFCKECAPLEAWGGCDCIVGMTVGEFRDLLDKYIEEDGLPLQSLVEAIVWDSAENEAAYPVTMLSCHVADKRLYVDAFGGDE